MIYRMGAAVTSLLGVFVAAYLYLYKIGRIGTLACGSGDCETVQTSAWSRFLGVDVALIGRRPALLLTTLAASGVLFTTYLTYVELFVLHAICRWCVGSAAIIVTILVLGLLELRRLRAGLA
jgi:uncharacterized membrane protein